MMVMPKSKLASWTSLVSGKKKVKELKGPELWSENKILRFKIAGVGQLRRGWGYLKGPGYAHEILESNWSWTRSLCPRKDPCLLLEHSLENHSKDPGEGCTCLSSSSTPQFTGIIIHLGPDSLNSLSFQPMDRWLNTLILLGQCIW